VPKIKTTWRNAEYLRGANLQESLNKVYASIAEPYKDELAGAGFLQRFAINYRLQREYRAVLNREVEIEVKKPNAAEIVRGLMGSSGIMLFLSALPFSTVLALDLHIKNALDWRGTAEIFLGITFVTAVLGMIFYLGCHFLEKKAKRKS